MSQTTLHTLNKAPNSHSALWQSCLAAIKPDDTLLLIEDGVYALASSTQLLNHNQATSVLYLKTDVEARGLHAFTSPSQLVSDKQFVELSCSHHKVVSWF
jgi:tRNA 2-thiouridine synthesizing protein B